MSVRFYGQKKMVHFEGSVPLWEQVQILPRSGEIDSKLDFGGSLLKLAHLNSIVETIGWNWLLWTRLWRPLAESDIPICATGITQMGQRVNAQQRKQILTSFALYRSYRMVKYFPGQAISFIYTLFIYQPNAERYKDFFGSGKQIEKAVWRFEKNKNQLDAMLTLVSISSESGANLSRWISVIL